MAHGCVDGNKRAVLIAGVLFLQRNGRRLSEPKLLPDEWVAKQVEDFIGGKVNEGDIRGTLVTMFRKAKQPKVTPAKRRKPPTRA